MLNPQKAEDRVGLVLKGRDVAFNLKDAQVDPKVLKVLLDLAEIQHVHSKAIAEMATMLDKMAGMLSDALEVQNSMGAEIAKFKRTYDENNQPE